jgi:hypothetical protein
MGSTKPDRKTTTAIGPPRHSEEFKPDLVRPAADEDSTFVGKTRENVAKIPQRSLTLCLPNSHR